MGERVVIHEEPPLASEHTPPREPPLSYGRGDRAGDIWRWITPRLRALGDAFHELFKIIIPALGGWRQIIFALGLGFCLGGLGEALASSRNSEPSAMMFLGGVLIGLVLRFPWLKG